MFFSLLPHIFIILLGLSITLLPQHAPSITMRLALPGCDYFPLEATVTIVSNTVCAKASEATMPPMSTLNASSIAPVQIVAVPSHTSIDAQHRSAHCSLSLPSPVSYGFVSGRLSTYEATASVSSSVSASTMAPVYYGIVPGRIEVNGDSTIPARGTWPWFWILLSFFLVLPHRMLPSNVRRTIVSSVLTCITRIILSAFAMLAVILEHVLWLVALLLAICQMLSARTTFEPSQAAQPTQSPHRQIRQPYAETVTDESEFDNSAQIGSEYLFSDTIPRNEIDLNENAQSMCQTDTEPVFDESDFTDSTYGSGDGSMFSFDSASDYSTSYPSSPYNCFGDILDSPIRSPSSYVPTSPMSLPSPILADLPPLPLSPTSSAFPSSSASATGTFNPPRHHATNTNDDEDDDDYPPFRPSSPPPFCTDHDLFGTTCDRCLGQMLEEEPGNPDCEGRRMRRTVVRVLAGSLLLQARLAELDREAEEEQGGL